MTSTTLIHPLDLNEFGERQSFATKPFDPAEFHPGYAGNGSIVEKEKKGFGYNPGEYHPAYAARTEDGDYTIPDVYKKGQSEMGDASDDDGSSSSSDSSVVSEEYEVPETYKAKDEKIYPGLD